MHFSTYIFVCFIHLLTQVSLVEGGGNGLTTRDMLWTENMLSLSCLWLGHAVVSVLVCTETCLLGS